MLGMHCLLNINKSQNQNVFLFFSQTEKTDLPTEPFYIPELHTTEASIRKPFWAEPPHIDHFNALKPFCHPPPLPPKKHSHGFKLLAIGY